MGLPPLCLLEVSLSKAWLWSDESVAIGGGGGLSNSSLGTNSSSFTRTRGSNNPGQAVQIYAYDKANEAELTSSPLSVRMTPNTVLTTLSERESQVTDPGTASDEEEAPTRGGATSSTKAD